MRALVEGGAQRKYGKLWLLLNLEAWYARWIQGRRSDAFWPEAPTGAVPEEENRRKFAAGALMSPF